MMKMISIVLVSAFSVAICSWGGSVRADDPSADQANVSQAAAKAFDATDVAFDRYVDLALVAHAWDTLNSELLADATLQMLEGERVLRRPNRVISADQLLQASIKVAIDNHDATSLDRLAQAASESGRAKVAEQIAQAEKLMAASRGDKNVSVASVDETSADQFDMQQSVVLEIRRAKLSGNADTLNAIEKDLASATALTEPQRKDLSRRILDAKASIAAGDTSSDATQNPLDKLSGASRQWFGPMGGFPPQGVGFPPYYPQHTTTWFRNPYDPGANIAIPGTNRYYSYYNPGQGWVRGNQYIGLDGRPHGSHTQMDPWGGSSTTAYYKKQ
jgi:hypothetical protein